MKSLIVLVVGLLSVGCLTPEQKQQKALRDSVVGEYEHKHENGNTYKIVLLDNGIVEEYTNGKKHHEGKWTVVKGEIHAKYNSGTIFVYIINTDKSIAQIAAIQNGKRFDLPKERQISHKKIK